VDNKGSLVALFESLEALGSVGILAGRQHHRRQRPRRGSGWLGRRCAATLLQQRGVEAEFVLDEGLAVVADFPLLGRPVALIGIAEKGYATLAVTAPAAGGHSSAPPPETGVETLALARCSAITSRAFPLALRPAAAARHGARPGAGRGLVVRMAVANEWLFAPLLVRQIAATPAGAASLHTTIAPPCCAAAREENVLPQDATAWINYRIAPGQTSAQVLERARSATRWARRDARLGAPAVRAGARVVHAVARLAHDRRGRCGQR